MTTPEPPPSFLTRLQRSFARMQVLSFSVLLHVVIVVVGGGTVLFQQYVEPPDFVAEGGQPH